MVYLTITAISVLVLWPVWVPLTIHGLHALANVRRTPALANKPSV